MPITESEKYSLEEISQFLPEESPMDLSNILLRLNKRSGDTSVYREFQINYSAGLYFFERMDFERSITYVEKCKHIEREFLSDFDLTSVHLLLGANYLQRADFDSAIESFDKVLSYNIVDQNYKALTNLSHVYTRMGQYDKALDYNTRVLSIEANLNEHMILSGYINNGFTHFAAGNYTQARKYYLQAQEIAKKSNNYEKVMHVTFNLGKTELLDGKVEMARKYFNDCLQTCLEQGYHYKRGSILFYLGKCALQKGDTERASAMFDEAFGDIKNKDAIHLMQLMNERFEAYEQIGSSYKFTDIANDLINIKHEVYDKNRLDVLRRLLKEKEDRITKLEKSNKEIEERKQTLEKHNEDLQEFARIVSEDFDRPLNQIKEQITQLESYAEEKGDDAYKDYLKYVTDSYSSLSQMLHKLQDYVSLHEKMDEVKDVSLKELLKNIIEILQKQNPEKQIKARYAHLPSIRMNEELAGELFFQICENAVKFNQNQEIQIDIRHWDKGQGKHSFECRDNGIGIKEEHRESTFRLFSRLHKDQYPGVGIGLAICKKIVQLHQGDIQMESNDMGGISLTFGLVEQS